MGVGVTLCPLLVSRSRTAVPGYDSVAVRLKGAPEPFASFANVGVEGREMAKAIGTKRTPIGNLHTTSNPALYLPAVPSYVPRPSPCERHSSERDASLRGERLSDALAVDSCFLLSSTLSLMGGNGVARGFAARTW